MPSFSADPNAAAPSLSWEEIERTVREKYPRSSAGPMLADVRGAMVALLMAERGVLEDEARLVLLHDDLRGLLVRAVDFARARVAIAKKDAGTNRAPTAAANRASRVATVARLVVPASMGKHQQRDVLSVVPPGWRPVVAVVEGHGVTACAKRRRLELLTMAFARQGVMSPTVLPVDVGPIVEKIRAECVLRQKTITNGLSDLRWALRACVEQGSLPTNTPVPAPLRGRKRLRGGADWYLDPGGKLRTHLPLFADDLEEFETLERDNFGGMPRRRRLAVNRVAMALVEMQKAGLLPGVDLTSLQILDLAQRQVPRVPIEDSAMIVEPRVSRAAARNGQRQSHETVPLVHAVASWMIKDVRAHKDGVGVPPIVSSDLTAVWAICVRLLRPAPEAGVEARVAWEVHQEVIAQWLNKAEKSRVGAPGSRDKHLLAEHLSLPQAIVFGLPWYTLIALPAADEARRGQPHGSPGHRAAETRLYELMDEWVSLATKIADPLRVEQRAYGRVGLEIAVDALFDDAGSLKKINRITTHFAGKAKHIAAPFGKNNPLAGFKQHQKGTRSWDWPPSIVDSGWFSRYLCELWYPRVRRLGETGTMAQAMSAGRWTLFPTTSNAGTSTSHPWNGMKGDWISETTGEALLRVMREALGHTHIPQRREDANAAGWVLLLSDHNIRHLWGSYWGGLREHRGPRQVRPDGTMVESITGMDYCRRATTDTANTIQIAYVALTQTIQRLLNRTVGSWDHPLSFDGLMDRVTLTDQTLDWASEWDTLASTTGAMPPALRERWLVVREAQRRRRCA